MCKGNPFSFPFTKVDWVVKRWLVYLSVYMNSDAQTCCFPVTKEFQSSLFFPLLFWLVRVNGGRVKNPSNQHWTWAHTRCGATFQAPQQPPQCLETQSRHSCVSQGHVALCKRKKSVSEPDCLCTGGHVGCSDEGLVCSDKWESHFLMNILKWALFLKGLC